MASCVFMFLQLLTQTCSKYEVQILILCSEASNNPHSKASVFTAFGKTRKSVLVRHRETQARENSFTYSTACFWNHLGLYGFTLPLTVFVYCHMWSLLQGKSLFPNHIRIVKEFHQHQLCISASGLLQLSQLLQT